MPDVRDLTFLTCPVGALGLRPKLPKRPMGKVCAVLVDGSSEYSDVAVDV